MDLAFGAHHHRRVLLGRVLLAAALVALAACQVAPPETPTLPAVEVAFPLAVAADGRHLVDRNGVPFLIQGDTPWSLTHNLTFEEAQRYVQTRRAQGFNALLVSVPDAYDADGKKSYSPDRQGQQPFVDDDLTRPNEPYWAHVDRVFAEVGRAGLLLMVAPAYLGADRDGYIDLLKKNGAARCRAYGLWLGRRYAGRGGLLWVLGGDRSPYDVQGEIRALAQALREADPRHLRTAHWSNGTSALDWLGDEGMWDVNSSYTYGPVAFRILADRARVPRRPTFLIESHYENDFGAKSADDVRAYPYRAVLSGAAGYLFGNRPLWFCGRGWEEALHSRGAAYMTHAAALFRSRPWHALEPDVAHQVVVAGHGESGADDGVQAALAGDGGTLIAYLPAAQRSISVDLERLSGRRLRGHWFDPRRGTATPIGTGAFERAGVRRFEAPGDADVVLVLDDEAKGYAAPGRR